LEPVADDRPFASGAEHELDSPHQHANGLHVEVGRRLPQIPDEACDEPRPIPALECDFLVMNDDGGHISFQLPASGFRLRFR
jgi:hypothetical protein